MTGMFSLIPQMHQSWMLGDHKRKGLHEVASLALASYLILLLLETGYKARWTISLTQYGTSYIQWSFSMAEEEQVV